MAGSSAALAFGALAAGAVILDYGYKSARKAFAEPASSSGGGGNVGGTPKAVDNFPASVNPLPGATGSRLDQGFDATGHTFPSPWSGHVVKATSSDPGWNGGGYVAVQSDADPSMVYFLAEGIAPIVKLGQKVNAGDLLALPRANPYNGIVGNVEVGRANPANPGQPLAQVISNPAGMVDDFYNWLRGLGAPVATTTAGAGYA